MNPPIVPPIGERIREERARRGVTVRGLARDIGVSASLISQIETGRSQPSVSTLYGITTVLDISIEDLFAPGDAATEPVEAAPDETPSGETLLAGEMVVPDATAALAAVHAAGTERSAAQPSPRPTPRTLGRDRGRLVGPVVQPDDREALTLESGVVWELLGQVPGVHVDFLFVTYKPGGSSSTSGALMRHTGTEYGYLIQGELILTLGFDEYHLQAGDAISFDSTTPHGYRNDGSDPAVGVWFVAESSH